MQFIVSDDGVIVQTASPEIIKAQRMDYSVKVFDPATKIAEVPISCSVGCPSSMIK